MIAGESTTESGETAESGETTDPTEPAGALSAAYLLGLADDALVYAQRLGEWMTNAPQIEEDMALGNISLDLLGQARGLYPYVGSLDGTGRGEDAYAMERDERSFRNVHLVEQPRGDFADEMARLLWFSAWQCELHGRLAAGSDAMLAAIAAKSLKEVRYHLDHASQWVVRLGDGTSESHRRMQEAVVRVAPYVEELFDDDATALAAVESGALVAPPSAARSAAVRVVEQVLDQATLTMPEAPRWRSRGGRDGVHSRPMGSLLAEMQHIARSHPGATW